MNLSFLSYIDWWALGWFLFSWIGYTFFAKIKQSTKPTIANQLAANRQYWLKQMIKREVRIADITSLGILQRNVTFFASTTIFIIAGLLTVLGSTEQAIQLISALPWLETISRAEWEIKIILMVVIFAYAFFKFTWAIRQYNFAIVLFGAAPTAQSSSEDIEMFVKHCNWLLTRATHSFNFGLRSYSFAIAALAWFVNGWIFILTTTIVVAVLYRREFKSSTLKALHHLNQDRSPQNTHKQL